MTSFYLFLVAFLQLTQLAMVTSFAPMATLSKHTPLILKMSDDSSPSDSASDDEGFWDDEIVEIEDSSATASAATSSSSSTSKSTQSLLDLMPTTATAAVTAESRAAINEAIYALEKCNPTQQPTVSPLLNGVWDLIYAGGYASEGALPSPTRQLALFLYSGGYSPALFVLSTLQKLLPGQILELNNLEITISRSQPRVEGVLKFKIGSFEATAKVVSRLETMSSVRLKETYESASFQELLNNVQIPEFLQYSRDLYITYVDEDLLIVRDASGVPEVLLRQEKEFSRNWGSEPSDADDMKAPGEY